MTDTARSDRCAGLGSRIQDDTMDALERLGFSYDPISDTLDAPEGWSIERLDGKSGLIRCGDMIRGGWGHPFGIWPFMKLVLLTRYRIARDKEDFDGVWWHAETVLDELRATSVNRFSSTSSQTPGLESSGEHNACAWLTEHFPDWQDPVAYWD